MRKIFSQCKFDPKVGGPLKVIVDMHHDDPRYLESRAIEMIREAQLAAINNQNEVYISKMELAITLLAMAQCINEHARTKSSKA